MIQDREPFGPGPVGCNSSGPPSLRAQQGKLPAPQGKNLRVLDSCVAPCWATLESNARDTFACVSNQNSNYSSGERYGDHQSIVWTGIVAHRGLLGVRWCALADTAPAPPGELEEITVTAQKRSESQQNVPMSITTFSAVALEQKDINNFFDYATKVPNLAFAPTGDGVGTARTVSIRGVSGNNVTSFYIDDTPLPDSIDPRVLDLDHIEILRGPAGHLVWRPLDGRPGAHRHQGAGPQRLQRDGARRHLGYRPYRQAQLRRRRRRQHSLDPR